MQVMEDRTLNPVPTNKKEISRFNRQAPPAHYILKIESCSALSEILKKTGLDKYESGVFEVGGYKWKLVLYPNGNAKRNANGYISLYLAMAETNTINHGCQVNLTLKLFIYDHTLDKYLTIKDGKVKRYHALKTEHGFHQLLPFKTFSDPCNGYLVDDCCVFGAEVHILKFVEKGEKFKILKEPENGSYTWKIDKFSSLEAKVHYSEVFTVAGYKWNLVLYPKGDSDEKGISLSLFLRLNSESSVPQQGVYVESKLLAKDQVNGKHLELTVNKWFSDSDESWGFPSFMLLSDLHNASKGFLVNDTLIVEGKITLISTVEALS